MSGSDRVVAAIVGGILSGRYGPGQKLIEADITQAVGMSRGPVREALKRLDAEGIVTLMPHRGAYIRAMTRDEAWCPSSEHLAQLAASISPSYSPAG